MSRALLIAGAPLTFPHLARADTPLNYMRTFGPAVDPITALNWGLLAVSLLVVIIITGLLLGALFRKRAEAPRDASGWPAVISRASSGLSWLYIGVGVSTVALFASAIWTFTTIAAVADPPTEPEFTIKVTGHQWWWEVEYSGKGSARAFTTANEIHIPVGEPVRIKVTSADVIHSFWVPQLAGKIDVIPGQTNVSWLQADKPGVYQGRCMEYCGLQHAHMALEVVAKSPQAFEKWWEREARSAAAPNSKLAQQGKRVFQAKCSVCHTVRGTLFMGNLGPDLTHVMSRRTLAAGLLTNNVGHLAGWIANAQALKPGVFMPRLALTSEELQAVLAYVKTLD